MNFVVTACLPLSFSHGQVSYNPSLIQTIGRSYIGTEAIFSCDSGYYLPNSAPPRVCQTSGNWNGENPTCSKKF